MEDEMEDGAGGREARQRQKIDQQKLNAQVVNQFSSSIPSRLSLASQNDDISRFLDSLVANTLPPSSLFLSSFPLAFDRHLKRIQFVEFVSLVFCVISSERAPLSKNGDYSFGGYHAICW